MEGYLHKNNLDDETIVVDEAGAVSVLGTILNMNKTLDFSVDGLDTSTAFEGVANGTYTDSNGNKVLVIDEEYTILERPRSRIYRQFDTVTRNAGIAVQTLTWFKPIKVRGNIRIEIKLPTRAETEGWGGLYCTPILTINGTKYDLGNEGWSGGVMARNARSIDEHTDEILINIAEVDESLAIMNTEYELDIDLEVRSYEAVTVINGSHSINRDIESDDGTPLISAQNQNWSTITVEEIEQEVILG